MSRRFEFDGVEVSGLTRAELFRDYEIALNSDRDRLYVGMYASLVRRVHADRGYRATLRRADVVYPDGMAIVWAARLLGHGPAERSATTDIWQQIVELGRNYGFEVVLLGGTQSALDSARGACLRVGANVAMAQDGYYRSDAAVDVAERVASLGKVLVLIGLGAGRQESVALSILDARQRANVTGPALIFTVGGLFDHIAETTLRAPLWVQRCGLEWLWRVAQEPRRLGKRYVVGNSFFLYRLFVNAKTMRSGNR